MVMARAPVVTVVILACSIWMLVEIGFLHGTKGANSYGPDPQSRCLKELRFEPNLPPYRPIKAPERTPLARMR
jgi:hypothetical protein